MKRELAQLVWTLENLYGESLPLGAGRDKKRALTRLMEKTRGCTNCALGHSRTRYVFGGGNPYARLVFVGEAPGAEEDRKGKPFVGRAGALLDDLMAQAGINRETDSYICNVLKCRPPNNRDPSNGEIETCRPILKAQLKMLAPALVVALGRYASNVLLGRQRDDTGSLASLRSKVHRSAFGYPLAVTYHPAAALRRGALGEEIVKDLNFVKREFVKRFPG